MSEWTNEQFAWSSANPNGSLVPILEASIEAAKLRHPSGKDIVPLTLADRCDRCGSAAVYRVGKFDPEGRPFNLDLTFCLHHWRKHFPSMADAGWKVIGSNPDHPALSGGPS